MSGKIYLYHRKFRHHNSLLELVFSSQTTSKVSITKRSIAGDSPQSSQPVIHLGRNSSI